MRELILLVLFSIYSSFAWTQNPIQNDTLGLVYNWNLDKLSQPQIAVVDTALELWHHQHVMFKNKAFYAYTGNHGDAAIANDYNTRISNPFSNPFLQPYAPYLVHYSNVQYYNARAPYSNFRYASSSNGKDKLEQTVQLFHTQNINPYLNAGFLFNSIDAEGQFNNQTSKVNSFTIFSSYNAPRYEVYFNASVNSIKSHENGGVDIGNYDTLSQDTKLYLVKLDNAFAKTTNKNAQLINKLKFGKFIIDPASDSVCFGAIDSLLFDSICKMKFIEKFSISHKIEYSDNYRWFAQPTPINNIEYYRSMFDSVQTFDSSYSQFISNSLQFEIAERKLPGFQFGIATELMRYSFVIHSDTTVNDTVSSYAYLRNSYIYANLFKNRLDNFNYDLSTRYYFSGYDQGNFLVDFDVRKKIFKTAFLSGFAYQSLKKPDYFYEKYSSNHTSWNQQLQAISTTKIGGDITFIPQKIKLEVVDIVQNNIIYFDSSLVCKQHTDPINVLAVNVYKQFKLGRFVFDNKVSWQKLSNTEVIRIPEVTLYNSTYFDKIFNFATTGGRIHAQFGFDTYYFSKYSVYSFSPVIGQFYVNDNPSQGNYIYADLFLNMKIKRMRIYLKMQHINQGWFGEEKNLATVWHYPLNHRTFMMGLSWAFYN